MEEEEKVPAIPQFQLTPPRGGDSAPSGARRAGEGFNSRPREGATALRPIRTLHPPVSTHAPARGRPPGSSWSDLRQYRFNSRPREGATPARRQSWITEAKFQLTPPRGGDESHGQVSSIPRGFNSRPREGATLSGLRRLSGSRRFQLTPPRGGDHDLPRPGLDPLGFNSRPREGATGPALLVDGATSRFNSRPREGATVGRAQDQASPQVSTHAPARGRHFSNRLPISAVAFQLTPPRGGDGRRKPGRDDERCFNSRPREGATRTARSCGASGTFQLTPPRGGDPSPMWSYVPYPKFQLTPPRGGDHFVPHCRRLGRVSTHAPARGRPGRPSRSWRGGRFQLTPPRGGDLRRGGPGPLPRGFNSRPREGATSDTRKRTGRLDCVSTHAPARGRLVPVLHIVGRVRVSTHAPARGRLNSVPGNHITD